MTQATSNPSTNLSSMTQAAMSDSRIEAEKQLDEKLHVMRELKTNMELNAREIGKLVNEIRDGKLWRAAGYNSADHCLKRKFEEIGRPRTLYRFADIARRFSDEDLRRFGTTKLEAILTHERQTGQQLPSENVDEQEISLTQKDGSGVVKKLKDCSSYELTRSNTNRRHSMKAEPISDDTAKPGMLRNVVVAAAGTAMLVVADLLPSSWLSGVMTLVGAPMLLAGGIQLGRRGYRWLVSFIHSGQAVQHLTTMPSKLSSLGRKVVAGLRKLASLFRAKQAIHVLAKLASKVPSFRRKQDQVPSPKPQTQPPVTGGVARPSAS